MKIVALNYTGHFKINLKDKDYRKFNVKKKKETNKQNQKPNKKQNKTK